MPELACVNGEFCPISQATVSIEDRGFQFADGVYEVIWIAGGRRVDEEMHLDRLDRSIADVGELRREVVPDQCRHHHRYRGQAGNRPEAGPCPRGQLQKSPWRSRQSGRVPLRRRTDLPGGHVIRTRPRFEVLLERLSPVAV